MIAFLATKKYMKKLIKIWHSGNDFHNSAAEITSYKGVLSYRKVAAALRYKSTVTGRSHIVASFEGAEHIGLNRKMVITSYGNLVALINYHLDGKQTELNKALIGMGSPPVKLSGILLHQYANLPLVLSTRADWLFQQKLMNKRFIIITPTKLDNDMCARIIMNTQSTWNEKKFWYTCDDPEEVSLIVLMADIDTIVVDTHKVKKAWS